LSLNAVPPRVDDVAALQSQICILCATTTFKAHNLHTPQHNKQKNNTAMSDSATAISPLVVMSIADHYTRSVAQTGAHRVVG
jgi:hypothetical protein